MENRERAKGAAATNTNGPGGGDIADAVKNLQRAVSMKLQKVLRKSVMPELKRIGSEENIRK